MVVMNKSANVLVISLIILYGICWQVCLLSSSLLTGPDRISILGLHNFLRRNFANGAHGMFVANMNKLTWSFKLERRATRALRCRRNFPNLQRYYKSNINIKTHSKGNISSDVMSWYNELDRHFFIPEDGSCWPSYKLCLNAYTIHFNIKPKAEETILTCLNNRNLLNAKHRSVGCAYRKKCPYTENILMCLYDESDLPFFKRGSVCTKCEIPFSFCEDGLCVRCNSNNDRCDCRKTCHVPHIGSGVLNMTSCTCHCQYGMGPNCDEPCENPKQFENYDICAEISANMCEDDEYKNMLAEFCPALCSCKKFPV